MAETVPTTSNNIAASVNGIASVLTSVNVAIPIVASVISTIITIVKSLKGPEEELAPILAALKAQIASNTTTGLAELERLRQQLERETQSAVITPSQQL
jgi:hypothetical protein